MSDFNDLYRGSFYRTEDGQRHFFPWGGFGGGYTVSSEAELKRLQREVTIYWLISVPLCLGAALWKGGPGVAVVLLFLVGCYLVWARSRCRRLEGREEKLAVSVWLEAQTRSRSWFGLWLFELAALALVGLNVFNLLHGVSWLVAAGLIVYFGLYAILFVRMMVVKWRQARPAG